MNEKIKIIEINDEIEETPDNESFSSERGLVLLKTLKDRCAKKSIPYEKIEDEFGECAKIGIKKGRDHNWIFLYSLDSIDEFLKINFENFVFLDEIEAIWNPDDNYIEAGVRAVPASANQIGLRRIFGAKSREDLPSKIKAGIIIENGNDLPKIKLSTPTRSFRLLTRSYSWRTSSSVTFKISNVTAENGSNALSILRKLSDSIFFQIDMGNDTSLNLAHLRSSGGVRRTNHGKENITINYPTHEYNDAPISLYWYARSAAGLPLLQYLAYYQVLEYFFGHYAVEEARRKIQMILKNPLFRTDRDTNITNIIAAIGQTRSGNFGGEFDQLDGTIKACISAEEIRNYLNDDDMKTYLLSSEGKNFHPIPVKSTTEDLRSDLARRIYDIRCRIVHTKADGGKARADLLLPFSKEAKSLIYDIEIIKYVSRAVLINASAIIRI